MSHASKKAVATAIVASAVVTVLKFLTAFAGGSPSMMNGAIHSLINTINQGLLFVRLFEAAPQPADESYTFGHARKKALWNRWSAVGLFSIGAGLGLAHAWHVWHNINSTDGPALIELFGIFFDPLGLALLVLFLALIIEGCSSLIALKAFLSAMRRDGCSNPFRCLAESKSLVLITMVREDAVAMLGLSFAITGVGLSAVTGNPLWDVGFSALIAIMLGGFACYLCMAKRPTCRR